MKQVKVKKGEAYALAGTTNQLVVAVQVVGVHAGVGGRHQDAGGLVLAAHRVAADFRWAGCAHVVGC